MNERMKEKKGRPNKRQIIRRKNTRQKKGNEE
jgi:hypothetical protein